MSHYKNSYFKLIIQLHVIVHVKYHRLKKNLEIGGHVSGTEHHIIFFPFFVHHISMFLKYPISLLLSCVSCLVSCTTFLLEQNKKVYATLSQVSGNKSLCKVKPLYTQSLTSNKNAANQHHLQPFPVAVQCSACIKKYTIAYNVT